MQQGWLKINDNGYSQITVEIDDRKIPLRYTVYQHEKLLEYHANQFKQIESNVKEAEKQNDKVTDLLEKGLDTFKKKASNALEICYIALNPYPEAIDFSKEDINEMLDLDQQQILSNIYLEKKVFKPSMDKENSGSKSGN